MRMIDKRTLLRALVAVGGLAATGALAQSGDPMAGVDHEGAVRIGRAWLALNSAATARALITDLFPNGPAGATLPSLAARVRSDFRDGRMFNADGWRLSDTEGRICAVLALR